MTDRTPHEGGRHTPEDLLDSLLVGNRVELLDTMTRALDTDAGLRALQTLRIVPPAKIEDRAGEARAPRTHPAPPEHEYAPLPIEGDPYPAIKLIQDLIRALMDLRRSESWSSVVSAACVNCGVALMKLSDGLEQRLMARGEAVELLTEATHHLRDLQSHLPPSLDLGPGLETGEIIVAFAEQLKRISVVVARMFDDAYDNISIDY